MKIKRTVYPEDYNKNNPMSGFNAWMTGIHTTLNNITGVTQIRKQKRGNELLNVFKQADCNHEEMENLCNQAKNILSLRS